MPLRNIVLKCHFKISLKNIKNITKNIFRISQEILPKIFYKNTTPERYQSFFKV